MKKLINKIATLMITSVVCFSTATLADQPITTVTIAKCATTLKVNPGEYPIDSGEIELTRFLQPDYLKRPVYEFLARFEPNQSPWRIDGELGGSEVPGSFGTATETNDSIDINYDWKTTGSEGRTTTETLQQAHFDKKAGVLTFIVRQRSCLGIFETCFYKLWSTMYDVQMKCN